MCLLTREPGRNRRLCDDVSGHVGRSRFWSKRAGLWFFRSLASVAKYQEQNDCKRNRHNSANHTCPRGCKVQQYHSVRETGTEMGKGRWTYRQLLHQRDCDEERMVGFLGPILRCRSEVQPQTMLLTRVRNGCGFVPLAVVLDGDCSETV